MMTSGTAENCASRGHSSCRDNNSNVFHESALGIGVGACINSTNSSHCMKSGCTSLPSVSSSSSSGNINAHEHNHESAGPSMKSLVSLCALYDRDKYSMQDIARIHGISLAPASVQTPTPVTTTIITPVPVIVPQHSIPTPVSINSYAQQWNAAGLALNQEQRNAAAAKMAAYFKNH